MMKSFLWSKKDALLFLLMVSAIVVTVGCRTYGSREVTVKLRTLPEVHANAYVVPLLNWSYITKNQVMPQPYQPPKTSDFSQQLERWHKQGQLTPMTTDTLPERCMYVVEYGGKYKWAIFNFSKQQEAVLSFQQ
jgi:hypothetical protein